MSLAFPVYLSLMTVTKIIIINTPTLTLSSQLHSEYPAMLTCPCTQPSTRYSRFLHMQPALHQVCSSDFVKQDWISDLALSTETKFPHDFQTTSPFAFQALATFCDLI